MESIIAQYKDWLKKLLAETPLPFDGNLRGALPTQGGVYRVFEKGSDWQGSVYVGKTGNLQERIYSNHLMGNRRASTLKRKLIKYGDCADEADVKSYLKSGCLMQFLVVVDETERTFFEHFAIAVLRPRYND